MTGQAGEITSLLQRSNAGDGVAEERLFELVYAQLKTLAASKLGGGDGRTLSPTALVNEAYLRVRRSNGIPLENRRHLFFAYGQAMWRIVVEHYRRKRIPAVDVDLATLVSSAPPMIDRILDLDDALATLHREYPREYEIAILRKVVGLGIVRTAEVLHVSPATVKRGWAFAKARLSLRLQEQGSNGRPATHLNQAAVQRGHRAREPRTRGLSSRGL